MAELTCSADSRVDVPKLEYTVQPLQPPPFFLFNSCVQMPLSNSYLEDYVNLIIYAVGVNGVNLSGPSFVRDHYEFKRVQNTFDLNLSHLRSCKLKSPIPSRIMLCLNPLKLSIFLSDATPYESATNIEVQFFASGKHVTIEFHCMYGDRFLTHSLFHKCWKPILESFKSCVDRMASARM